ncbi:hypothetical protein KIH87_04710 [Paraneptunicella aestuarii]|uniref:hypothetical protein n=1 Tax=Paraneptunicella aestuarii TaxID=2831148 RepID=UPI001E3E3358|nr:hypothetical protein [Paraneptunicella aestuarii]UAA39662.1 hypothetical protein KIH87_04710 [Paraneptunicella aestuarii]
MNIRTKLVFSIGCGLIACSLPSVAGSFQAVTSESVGVEAATGGGLKANIAGDSITIQPGSNFSPDNRLFLSLNNGATFADAAYTLETSLGGAGTGNLTEFVLITQAPAGSSVLEFRVVSGITASDNFLLSGSSIAGQSININMPALSAGAEIDIDANADDSFGTFDFFSSLELFQYSNEFSARTDVLASAIIDVDDSRNSFVGGITSDTIALEFVEANITNGVSLNDDDKVLLTLSGDMSGIQSIMIETDGVNRGNFVIDEDAGTATFSLSASDAFRIPTVSSIITANVWGSSPLSTRSFTVKADLDFQSETDKNVIAENTDAGSWSINGLQAKVSHLSLNASGFVSWLKIVNEGTVEAAVTADIIWTLADGTEGSATNKSLGTVDAGGILTISEETILSAMNSPTQLADASLTVTVAGQTNFVHLIAEKKAADGRLTIPVYYNTGGANPRVWIK